MSSYTLSAQGLKRLVGARFRPPDDGPTPVGPGGPVLRDWWSFINPQPLPPRDQVAAVANIARAVIGRALSSYEDAGIIVVGGDVESVVGWIQDGVEQFVDELCPERPTRPRPWPWPWKWVFDGAKIDAVAIVVAATQFRGVADALGEHPLQPAFADAADRLFESGLAHLEQTEG